MKKRALSLMLALAMCLGLAVPALAAEEPTFVYETTGHNELTVTQSVGTVTGEAEVPYMYGGKPVTGLGRGALSGIKGMNTVRLNRPIRYIDAGAFEGCPLLETIRFGGSRARWNTMQADVPRGVEVICEGVSTPADGLDYEFTERGMEIVGSAQVTKNQAVVPSAVDDYTVKAIMAGAFSAAPGMEKLFLPSSLDYIDYGAFRGCKGLHIYYAGTRAQWERILDGAYRGAVDGCEVTFEIGGPDEVPADGKAPVSSVSLNKTRLTLAPGSSETLTARVQPANADYKAVCWYSSDESVARVDESGRVTAVKEGSAVITAVAGKKSADCRVTVEKEKPIRQFTLSQTSLNLQLRDTADLNTNPPMPVTWSSEDPSVARVDQTGYVTVVGYGTTRIVATSDQGVTAFCTVTVKKLDVLGGVSLDKTNITLRVGETATLTARVDEGTASEWSVSWVAHEDDRAKKSPIILHYSGRDNDPVATITAERPGTIRYRASVGSRRGRVDSGYCTITVVDKDRRPGYTVFGTRHILSDREPVAIWYAGGNDGRLCPVYPAGTKFYGDGTTEGVRDYGWKGEWVKTNELFYYDDPDHGASRVERIAADSYTLQPGEYRFLMDTSGETMQVVAVDSTSTWFVKKHPADWARDIILRGCLEGYFPRHEMERKDVVSRTPFQDKVTRRTFCSYAVAAVERVTGRELPLREQPFTDSDDPDILKAARAGIVDGFPDGSFHPNENLTREQAAVIMVRAAELMGISIDRNPPPSGFTDGVAKWAAPFVDQVKANRIMAGMGGASFAPKMNCSLEQTMVMMMNLVDRSAK